MRGLETGKSFPFWEFVRRNVLFELNLGCGRPVVRAEELFSRCPPLGGAAAFCYGAVRYDELCRVGGLKLRATGGNLLVNGDYSTTVFSKSLGAENGDLI
jgi:hypothetical protein